jgi:hypothetical protein
LGERNPRLREQRPNKRDKADYQEAGSDGERSDATPTEDRTSKIQDGECAWPLCRVCLLVILLHMQ